MSELEIDQLLVALENETNASIIFFAKFKEVVLPPITNTFEFSSFILLYF